MNCPWRFVAVWWVDAFDGESGWTNVHEYRPHANNVVSVGWEWPDLLDGYVTLVSSTCPEEYPDLQTVGQVLHIPLAMVEQCVVLVQPVFEVADHADRGIN